MAADFSWRRARQAMRDAWTPLKETRALMLRVVTALAAIGYSVGAYLKPETLLPASPVGKLLLGFLFLLLILVPVQTAYRLRSQLDDLSSRIAAIPDNERDLILKLRMTAGRVLDQSVNPFSMNDPGLGKNLQRLRRMAGNLRHYPHVYSAAVTLVQFLVLLRAARQSPVAEYQEAAQKVRKAYERVVEACDDVLRPRVIAAKAASRQ